MNGVCYRFSLCFGSLTRRNIVEGGRGIHTQIGMNVDICNEIATV